MVYVHVRGVYVSRDVFSRRVGEKEVTRPFSSFPRSSSPTGGEPPSQEIPHTLGALTPTFVSMSRVT